MLWDQWRCLHCLHTDQKGRGEMTKPQRTEPMKPPQKEVVYITRYALTDGIYQMVAECDGRCCRIRVEDIPKRHAFFYAKFADIFYDNHWHRTPEAAIARAEEMRRKRLKSLHTTIAKLERLNYEDIK